MKAPRPSPSPSAQGRARLLLPLLLVACGPAAVTLAPSTTHPILTQLRCNQDSRWGAMMRADAKAGAGEVSAVMQPHQSIDADAQKAIEKVIFWRMVRAVLLEGNNNNVGVIALRGRTWKDGAGVEHPLLVFRSGITPAPTAPDSCFASLLGAGQVRHVVNLFDGDLPIADLIEAETRAATAAGASYRTATDGADGYGPWRDLIRKRYDDGDARRRASLAVARLIRELILAPGGQPPRGNVYFHCGGGMHRSGMIAGVIERCVNREPWEQVEAHYHRHVAWQDAAHPGGAEPGNLRFIRDFDCALLE